MQTEPPAIAPARGPPEPALPFGVGSLTQSRPSLAEAALAIELGTTVSDVAQTIHAHPTLPEGHTVGSLP